MCTHMDSFGYYYICPYGFFWMLLYIHIDYFECDFNIGYFKYPNISVLSLQDGCTDATQHGCFTNFPHANDIEVFPVPDIPCNITNFVEAIAETNNLIIFSL